MVTRFKLFAFLIVTYFGALSSASAVTVKDIYRANVIVGADVSEQEMLKGAFANAAFEVLARVSGRYDSVNGVLRREIVLNAPKWVAEHSVRAMPGLQDINGDLKPGKEVSVTFYPQLVDQYLYAKGLPVWGANRPSVLVWLVSESQGRRFVSSAMEASEELVEFYQASQKMGLPVYAPLVDETDQRVLPTSELWGMFEDSIRKASARYQTDMVLAVRVGGGQSGAAKVELYLPNGEVKRWEQVDGASSLMEGVSIALAGELSQRYASVRSGETNSLLVRVTNIKDQPSLQRVSDYIGQIDVVRRVRLSQLDDDAVEWLLTLDGTREKLMNVVQLQSMLVPRELNALDPDANRIIWFEYNRGG